MPDWLGGAPVAGILEGTVGSQEKSESWGIQPFLSGDGTWAPLGELSPGTGDRLSVPCIMG